MRRCGRENPAVVPCHRPQTHTPTRSRLWVVGRPSSLVILALALAACGEYPGVPHPLAGQLTPAAGAPAVGVGQVAPAAVPGAAAPPAQPAAGAAAAQPVASGGPVQVQLKDFTLDPNQVSVRAGPVRFQLLNRGRYTHDFRIRGSGFEQKAPLIGAGRDLAWEVTLTPGEYEIACPVSDHAERGMTGKLVVVR